MSKNATKTQKKLAKWSTILFFLGLRKLLKTDIIKSQRLPTGQYKNLYGGVAMAQSYVWKVSYNYRKGVLSRWASYSKIFTNKVEALKFANQMQNDKHARCVKLLKWRG